MWIDAYVIAEQIVQNAFGQFYPPDPTRLAAKKGVERDGIDQQEHAAVGARHPEARRRG